MKTKELREKSDKELRNLIKEKREKLGKLKFNQVVKKLKNVNEMSALRKIIAQSLTILKERQNGKTKDRQN